MSAEADDLIDSMYAEWLMAQPELCIGNGHMLVNYMDRQWGFYEFVAQLPEQLRATLEEE